MISLQNISRYYAAGERSVHALDDVSLTVGRHEFVAVVGPSGCGKSTLMHLIAGLDRPTAGEIVVDGLNLTTADDAQLTNFRRRQLGLVFQFFNLLPTMNALENVSLPLLLQGVPLAESDRAGARAPGAGRPNESRDPLCSSTERRRTAADRDCPGAGAPAVAPHRRRADRQPRHGLGGTSAGTCFGRLRDERLTTLILVTHSAEVAEAASRMVEMRDGRIVSDRPVAANVG